MSTWTTFISERHLCVDDLASSRGSDSDLLMARRPNTDYSVTIDPKYSYFVVGRTSYYKSHQVTANFTDCHFAENRKDLTMHIAAASLSFARLKGSAKDAEQLTTSSSASTLFPITTFIDEKFDDAQWN